MSDESKISKTLTGYQTTKENFARTAAGKYFAYIRNTVWFCYFLLLMIGAGLLVLQPTCGISKNPVNVTGCQLLALDMNPIIAFFAKTHIFGLIIITLCLLVIKAFFIIKFINVKIKPE